MTEETKSQLTRYVSDTNPKALADLYLIIAKNIEESLIASGAEPGKDYQILDLYQLAQPFVLHMFKTNPDIYFSTKDF